MIVSLKLTAKLRWFFWKVLNERERRGLNHVLIWFAEVTCLSDTPHAKNFFTLGGSGEETGGRERLRLRFHVYG